jgi:hypothetical protein
VDGIQTSVIPDPQRQRQRAGDGSPNRARSRSRSLADQIPDRPERDDIVIVGPTRLLQQVIRGAVCVALGSLAERVDDGPAGDPACRTTRCQSGPTALSSAWMTRLRSSPDSFLCHGESATVAEALPDSHSEEHGARLWIGVGSLVRVLRRGASAEVLAREVSKAVGGER